MLFRSLVALWEPRLRRLTLCNAGAEPPLVYRRGEVLKVRAEGVPIGLLEDRQYEEVEFRTEPGDTILFFSDGVEDQLDAKEEEYTRARATRLLKKHGSESPKAIADRIFADLDSFRDDVPITDDQTVVVIKVAG